PRLPPCSPLFPYTTLFRSVHRCREMRIPAKWHAEHVRRRPVPLVELPDVEGESEPGVVRSHHDVHIESALEYPQHQGDRARVVMHDRGHVVEPDVPAVYDRLTGVTVTLDLRDDALQVAEVIVVAAARM